MVDRDADDGRKRASAKDIVVSESYKEKEPTGRRSADLSISIAVPASRPILASIADGPALSGAVSSSIWAAPLLSLAFSWALDLELGSGVVPWVVS